MNKQVWKPGNMLYPLPVVLVSTGDREGNQNLFTVAWTGMVCTNPAMVSISVRPQRYSYSLLKDSGEFVINLTTEEMAYAVDYCGVVSGENVDKWEKVNLHPGEARSLSYAPVVEESPVNLECRITEVQELGSHHMFLADITAVQVDEAYIKANGELDLDQAHLLAYNHGRYVGLGKSKGTFGFSVRKKKTAKRKKS